MSLMNFLVSSQGYCCAHRYVTSTLHIPAWDLAHHLGVHRRTVHYWRQWVREGKLLPCGKCQSTPSPGSKDSPTSL